MRDEKLLRVSRRRPCPVCDKLDWCLVAEDGSRAICARVESDRRAGEAGWFHRISERGPARSSRPSYAIELRGDDFSSYAARCQEFRDDDGPVSVAPLARELGVSTESLNAIRVGWNGWAWTFPMCDAHGVERGVRLRRPDGSKLAVKGSRQGLFLPTGMGRPGPLLITEGPTDAAAALDLGFAAIGRPSCNGGHAIVSAYVRRHKVSDVVVLADRDEQGRRGAWLLVQALACYTRVRTIETPEGSKDLRAWYRAGAIRSDVATLIENAEVVAVRAEVVQ